MPHVQIRNVPPDVHRRLKVKAAQRGMSLSDFLLEELRPIAELPTTEELVDRLQALSECDPPESSADAIRAERDRS